MPNFPGSSKRRNQQAQGAEEQELRVWEKQVDRIHQAEQQRGDSCTVNSNLLRVFNRILIGSSVRVRTRTEDKGKRKPPVKVVPGLIIKGQEYYLFLPARLKNPTIQKALSILLRRGEGSRINSREKLGLNSTLLLLLLKHLKAKSRRVTLLPRNFAPEQYSSLFIMISKYTAQNNIKFRMTGIQLEKKISRLAKKQRSMAHNQVKQNQLNPAQK